MILFFHYHAYKLNDSLKKSFCRLAMQVLHKKQEISSYMTFIIKNNFSLFKISFVINITGSVNFENHVRDLKNFHSLAFKLNAIATIFQRINCFVKKCI